MKRIGLFGLSALIAATPALAQSDAQVRQRIIRESVSTYPGACPCPYSAQISGQACGTRSAYHRPGTSRPICYPADISAADLQAWRRSHR